MKMPCEVAVKSVVPAIRSLLAKELISTHRMKQTEVATLLGITQTAVSKYTHRVRGRVLSSEIQKEEEVKVLIMKTADSLVNGNLDRTALALRICTTCKLIREKGLMCDLCRRADSSLKTQQCLICVQEP